MKYHTGIQKIFKRRWDNLYEEFIIHLIHCEDDIGNRTTRQDKTIKGGLYKEAKEGEYSAFGEVTFFDVQENRDKRLILLRTDYQ